MSLKYSEINFNEEEKKKKKRKNITLKTAKKPHEKIRIPESSGNLGQHFLNNNNCNDDDDLADFTPYQNNEKKCDEEQKFPPLPKITSYPSQHSKDDKKFEYNPNVSTYSANQASTGTSYIEHFVPKLTNASNLPQDELMVKLNHILHLLEEQKDTRTDNITEELILYLFLGVFVIFSIDSFTKVGKYTR
tara:strand:- start:352 stop:921 length:570 start_codon:yes stop_codon:yes gene_type:complete